MSRLPRGMGRLTDRDGRTWAFYGGRWRPWSPTARGTHRAPRPERQGTGSPASGVDDTGEPPKTGPRRS